MVVVYSCSCNCLSWLVLSLQSFHPVAFNSGSQYVVKIRDINGGSSTHCNGLVGD